MNLANAQIGQSVIIDTIECPETQSQIIRLGLMVGDQIMPINRVPGGPTIIKKGMLEVAFGKELAAQIKVNLA
jgi:Fe2+ transport system protein FeoA